MAPKQRASIDPNLFAKTEPQPAQPQDTLPLRQHDSKALRQQDAMTAKPQSGKLVKATIYLPPETLAGLDDARARLRAMMPAGSRARITLSAIVGAALEMALEELERDGEESRLAALLAKQDDGKTL